ncbi:cytidylate kinase [Lentzea albidocapillata]|uniref:Cytidylate kinase n=1 Tax=Lentzea albidocapillata TaxID=40571 RepID=A0A1W2FSG7_9PSEU|nr:cytidylate kinase [Lentzea albidocapillata]
MGQGQLRGVVALDGPAGTGKSTVAKRLATALDARYLDTGSMYRAIALAVLRAGVDPADEVKVAAVVDNAMLVVGTDPRRPGITLDGDDVSAEIRGPEVSLAVSPVSATGHVRELLVAQQRAIIADAVDHVGGIVVEGRDIGTVVSPDAPLKVYLTASADARAARRTKQDNAAGRQSTVDAALADVQRRDKYDSSRAVSPMKAADDAVVLDNTDLDLVGTVHALLELVDRRGLRVTG